ncbi:MAG TPA: recombinase family protein [Bradyrhizobium sp.]|nr:recombinase family protein [Bradyrhizobium sp.]
MSATAIAAQLSARKIATARGGAWSHVQVGTILRRAMAERAGSYPQAYE